MEYLPSGSLPEGTWETYAYNLGGDSEVTFTQPITVRLQNSRGFAPGTSIPLGYWNQNTQQWEHAGTGVVDASGQWVEMRVTHFSNCNCNDPISDPDLDTDEDDDDEDDDDDDDECPAGAPGCWINLKSGKLLEDFTLPGVTVLGDQVAPQLRYDSQRADPSAIIDVKVSVINAAEIGDHLGWELYIEGEKTDSFTFEANLDEIGEVGRFRYLWDGRDAQGNRLPPGVYDYQVKISLPYRGQYCYASGGIFGNPPDCVYGATGRFVDAVKDIWVSGTIELNAAPAIPFGAGWVLDGQQRLYEDEAGRILVTNGGRSDEFYFPYKDLLNGGGTSLLAQRPQVAGAAASAVPHPPAPSPEITRSASLRGASRKMISGEGEQPTPLSNRLPLSIGEGPGVRQVAPLEPAPDFHSPVMGNRLPYTEFQAATGLSVCGSIVTNTVWTAANSPYQVTCDVSVSANVALTIEPGVTVRFQHTGDDLIISGRLQAIGTEITPIYFQPLSGTIAGSWGRVAFLAGSIGVLDHTVLEYGGSSSGLVYIASNAVQVLEFGGAVQRPYRHCHSGRLAADQRHARC